MAFWSLQSIDESAFLNFCNAPTEAQLAKFCSLLPTFCFEQTLDSDSIPSIRQRLSSDDWYLGFEPRDMYAWEFSVGIMLGSPEFLRRTHGQHGAVSDVFIEMASDIYAARGVDAVVRNFWPYRFTNRYGAASDGFFPSSALIDNLRLKQLLAEIRDYEKMLNEYRLLQPAYVDSCRDTIKNDLAEAIPALDEICATGRMWAAVKDQ